MKDKIFRSSFFSIFDNTLKITWIAIVLIITNFAIIKKKVYEFNLNININLTLIIFLVIFIVIVFIYYCVNFYISRFKIQDNLIVAYKNIFVKDKKEFLINNIANVCISKNIFEKILKLSRIRIFTNRKNKVFCDFEVIINDKTFNNYINPMFEKCNIFIHKNKEKNKINFNIFNIIKHSFLSISITSIIIIINFILLVFSMIKDGTLVKEVLTDFLGLIITILGFVFPVIYSVLKNTIKYLNFKIRRDKLNIYISYGIFTVKQYIIPINKINGLIIDVSLLSKIFGCYKLNVINSGIGDRKSELEMLFPISRIKKCRDILNVILPEYDITMQHKRQPYESIIIIGVKMIIFMLILVIPLIYINIKLAIFISLFLFLLVIIFFLIKRTIISDKYICVINGIFIKRIKIINYEKIENIEIKEGIISKRLRLYKVYINILSNIKNNKISSGYIKEKDFYKIIGNIENIMY